MRAADLAGRAVDIQIHVAVDVGRGEDRHAARLVHLQAEVLVLQQAAGGVGFARAQRGDLFLQRRIGLRQRDARAGQKSAW